MTRMGTMRLAAISALLALSVSGQAAGQSADTGPLRIGGLLPLTGAGAASGQSQDAGVRLAIDEFNKAGGINGRDVEYLTADDQNDSAKSVAEARRLTAQERVNFIYGPNTSANVLAVSPIITEGNILYMGAPNAQTLTPEKAPNWFSVFGSAQAQGEAMANYAFDVAKVTTAGILFDSGPNSRTIAAALKEHFEERGGKVVQEEYFEGGASDVTPQVLRQQSAKPGIMFLSSSGPADMGIVLKNVDELGWDVQIAGTTAVGAFYNAIRSIAGDDITKEVVGLDFRAFTYCPGDPEGTSEFSKFVDRIKAFMPDKAEQLSFPFVALGYDGATLYKAAVEATGGTDGPTLVRWIEQHASEVKLITGVAEATETSHFLFGADVFTMVQDIGNVRSDGLKRRVGC